jgi:hypothetical protein
VQACGTLVVRQPVPLGLKSQYFWAVHVSSPHMQELMFTSVPIVLSHIATLKQRAALEVEAAAA